MIAPRLRSGRGQRVAGLGGFRDLPLFWKLLVPYFTLIVIIGVLGAFLIVRELSGRAESAIDQDLGRRSIAASAALRDRELYLLESASFAGNVQGMAPAVQSGDAAAASRLLSSVLALKPDLSLALVTSRDGRGLSEFVRPGGGALAPPTSGADWGRYGFVKKALKDPSGTKAAGFLTTGGSTMLALASPICSSSPRCGAVGVAVVAIDAAALVRSATPSEQTGKPGSETGIALYATNGRELARTGLASATAPAAFVDAPVRALGGSGKHQTATLLTPLVVQGRTEGVLAVSILTSPAFGAVRSAALRLALIVLAAMLGIVAIGAVLSRFILGQVRPLVAALQALGAGDLSARAHRVGDDELGRLADGVNTMAGQLQTSYETLEQRVEERTEEVQRLLRERTQFFAAMSHEFRTPVAVVLSQAQMLADPDFPKSLKWQADAGRILSTSGEQLLSLVSDILDLAKAEAGKLEVELEDLALPELFKELRPTAEGLAAAAELSMRISAPARLPAVRADKSLLRTALLNLVDNAVKYTPAGGSVTVSAVALEGHVAVTVRDTGLGIPDAESDRLFEPFYRVRSNRTQRGQPSSGLGLAVTKRIVEAQGGSIDFTSARGTGTSFTVVLPIAPAKQDDAPLQVSRTADGDGQRPAEPLLATTASKTSRRGTPFS